MNNFLENSNKALLWNLLYEQNIFSDIPDSKRDSIKNLFDKELVQIFNSNRDRDRDREVSLIDLNKIAVQYLIQKITEYKNPLSKKQEEFESLIKAKKPEKPNFSDAQDEPFDTENMDTLLNQMISSREAQLQQVIIQNQTHNPSDQKDQEGKQSQLALEDLNIKKLNIGDTINSNVLEIKKVSFSQENETNTYTNAGLELIDSDKFLRNIKKKRISIIRFRI